MHLKIFVTAHAVDKIMKQDFITTSWDCQIIAIFLYPIP